MTKKEFAKKYVISAVLLFFALFLLSALILFLLAYSGKTDLENSRIILTALAAAIIPCGSFTGFVMVFTKIKTLTKFWKIALCVLFPVTLTVITVLGIVSFLPYLIYSVFILIK